MTPSNETGNPHPSERDFGSGYGGPDHYREFSSLDSQLEQVTAKSGRIVRKHWPQAEREQYPFWIGILVLAVLGLSVRYMWEPGWFATAIPLIMLAGVVVVVIYQIRSFQGRFERLWSSMCSDGELFKFLRDAGALLGHPVEMGKSDERFSTRLDIPFPEVVRAAESWLRHSALPDPVPPDAPPGLYVPALTIKQPPGTDTHRVYEVEYRGTTTRAFSIRIGAADAGTEVTVGFALRPARAETRDRVTEATQGRLQDRLITAKVLSDIREAAGAEPVPIPASEAEQPTGGPATSQAI